MKQLGVLVFLLLAVSLAHAGIEEGLNQFFDSFGVSANYTAPGLHQSAGYYSGGSLMARGKAKNYQLLSVQPPSFKVGCGGIDLFMGGISHIKGDDIKRMAAEIGQGAAFFAMSIALQTLTPQIKSVTDHIMSIARDVNNMNINTCQASAALVGSLWPKTEASSQVLCRSLGLGEGSNNGFTDYAHARQGCGNPATRNQFISNMHNKPQFADQLGEEFNLAWKALGKTRSMTKDEREWFMSISGSIIARKSAESEDNDRGISIARLPSLAKSEDWLKGMLDGNGNGTLSVYRCGSDDKCLHPTLSEAVPVNKMTQKSVKF